jgi:DNA polymerase III alpha subunit
MVYMTNKERLDSIVIGRMRAMKLSDPAYVKRATYELIEITVQEKHDYFMDLYDAGKKFRNRRNLLVPYLLGLCSDFDIGKEPHSEMKEYPDIDMDFLDIIRIYIRHEFAPKVFGEGNVACICTYQTYVLKQALIDMARVFGLDRNEIQAITKQFSSKDDEGDALSWEKAQELYSGFKKWCEKYPEAAEAAKKLQGRIRQMSQHAGGFIISDRPLEGFAPLVKNKKDESMMTAWPEGQSSQDLMEVGLIKYDFLSSKMQEQIVDCVGMILKDGQADSVCAKPGMQNWSDDSYLNDPVALKMADKGDLRFIFQFDSDGMRRLVRMGGVDRFQDLEVYSAIYRPGPLGAGMHEVYCKRKHGKEKFTIHPLLQPYLGKTYGVMVYQEQVMQVLHAAGEIPMRNAYEVVKAISKKKIEKFAKYKDQFITNSQRNLGLDEDGTRKLWDYIEEFAGYGFNKAHSCVYTHQSCRQLYLKAHFPLYFFCSMFNHINEDEKRRDCKRDAEAHGVKVNQVNINKSCAKFCAHNGQIYFGFSNIKHVGEELAWKIIEERDKKPFEGFRDFLNRFGTDAKTIQALVSLGAFHDEEPDKLKLWKYYEVYKSAIKKDQERSKRHVTALARYEDQLRTLANRGDLKLADEWIDYAIETAQDNITAAALRRLKGNLSRSLTRHHDNKAAINEVPELKDFNPDIVKVSIKDEVYKTLTDTEAAQMQFYGFCWANPLDNCKDIEGTTFEYLRGYPESQKDVPIEGLILDAKEKTSAKGNRFRTLVLQDQNWETAMIYVWEDELQRFRNDLVKGNIVRLRVQRPTEKFTHYSLLSYPPYKREKAPKLENDYRVVVLQRSIPKQSIESVIIDKDENPVTLNIHKSNSEFNHWENNESDIRRYVASID